MSDVKPAIEAEDYRHIVRSKLLLLAVVGFTVQLNSLIGVLVLDDQRRIINNPDVRSLTLSGDGWLSTRRVVLFTFAVNHAISGIHSWSYHALNMAIHILAGLALFGIVCRTLLCTYTDPRSQEMTPWIAFVAALLWMVHPLQTASVTYVSMRAETLMGLFYLTTLYCVIRGAEGTLSQLWYGLAIAACAGHVQQGRHDHSAAGHPALRLRVSHRFGPRRAAAPLGPVCGTGRDLAASARQARRPTARRCRG